MKIHFIKNDETGNWHATEQFVQWFHSSLCETIRTELANVSGLIFCPFFLKERYSGLIVFTFNDPADEAAFILKFSDGMDI